MKEILGINIPRIRVYRDNTKIIILFTDVNNETNSLLTFSDPGESSDIEISDAVNKSLSAMDWGKTFDEVYSKQEYRKAVMNIPVLLMGEP